jgi:hypothetical protein
MPDHHPWHLLALLSCLALVSCDKEAPKGQVIAVVNGEEITVAELNYEAGVRNLRIEDDAALRRALVRELVERRLLVDQAAAAGLDRTPEFILAERRQRDILLAQQLIEQGNDQKTPSPADVRAFIESKPRIFSERVVADVQLFRLPAGGGAVGGTLRSAPSREELAATLFRARNVARPIVETWDSADPANPLASGEVAPIADRVFRLERNGEVFVGTIARLSAHPVPAEQREPLARALMKREASASRMNALLGEARKRADIRLQPGFDTDGPAAKEH